MPHVKKTCPTPEDACFYLSLNKQVHVHVLKLLTYQTLFNRASCLTGPTEFECILQLSVGIRAYLVHVAGSSPAGGSGALPPNLNLYPISYFTPCRSINPLLYEKKCGSPCDFCPPLLRNPGDGPGMLLGQLI